MPFSEAMARQSVPVAKEMRYRLSPGLTVYESPGPGSGVVGRGSGPDSGTTMYGVGVEQPLARTASPIRISAVRHEDRLIHLCGDYGTLPRFVICALLVCEPFKKAF